MKEKILTIIDEAIVLVQKYWEIIFQYTINLNEHEIYIVSITAIGLFLYLVYRVLNFLVALFVMFAFVFAYGLYVTGVYKMLLDAI